MNKDALATILIGLLVLTSGFLLYWYFSTQEQAYGATQEGSSRFEDLTTEREWQVRKVQDGAVTCYVARSNSTYTMAISCLTKGPDQ